MWQGRTHADCGFAPRLLRPLPNLADDIFAFLMQVFGHMPLEDQNNLTLVFAQQKDVRVISRHFRDDLLHTPALIALRWRAVAAPHPHERHQIPPCDQVDFKRLALLDGIGAGDGAGDELQVQALAQRLAAGGDLFLQRAARILLFLLALQLGCDTAQHAVHVLNTHRLEQIFGYA